MKHILFLLILCCTRAPAEVAHVAFMGLDQRTALSFGLPPHAWSLFS